MRVVATGSGPAHRAPFPKGPSAEVLVDEQSANGQLAAAYVTIPAGGTMPEHAHGESIALVVPFTGELLIRSGRHEERVARGVVVLLDQGERVSVSNETSQPASLLGVFAPAGFIGTLVSWPTWTAQDAVPNPPQPPVVDGVNQPR